MFLALCKGGIYMTHHAIDVARWLLRRNEQEKQFGDAENVTNLKLQKLLYYVQGIYLGMYGTPIFEEQIEAWTHGPVVPEIYREYKCFGSNGIVDPNPPFCTFVKEEEDIMEWVYNEFGQYTAWKLRDMTHQEDPWKSTPQCGVIDNGLIKKYFEENYIEET